MSTQLAIKLVRKPKDSRQKAIAESLGLRRLNSVKVHKSSPSLLGATAKIIHLLNISNMEECDHGA